MIYSVFLFLEILVLYFLSKRVVRVIYRLFYKVTKRRNWTMYLFAVAFWPGTFIHEISHFLAALLLFVPVGKIELIPNIEEEAGSRLGSVAIAKTDPIRRFLIGVAPLLFGLGIIFLSIYLLSMNSLTGRAGRFIDSWYTYVIVGYLIFQISNSMFASKKDLEGAVVFFVLLLIILLILLLVGVDIPAMIVNLKFSEELLKTLKMANLFLLVPIIIDLLVLFVLKTR